MIWRRRFCFAADGRAISICFYFSTTATTERTLVNGCRSLGYASTTMSGMMQFARSWEEVSGNGQPGDQKSSSKVPPDESEKDSLQSGRRNGQHGNGGC